MSRLAITKVKKIPGKPHSTHIKHWHGCGSSSSNEDKKNCLTFTTIRIH